MRIKSFHLAVLFIACLSFYASEAQADLFGSGDSKKAERILLEIKKLNTRIVEEVLPKFKQVHSNINSLRVDMNSIRTDVNKIQVEIGRVKAEISKIKSGHNSLAQEMDILKNVIPQMQGSMENSQAQAIQKIQKMGNQLNRFEEQMKEERKLLAGNQIKELKTFANSQKAEMNSLKQEIEVNIKGLKEGMAKDMEKIAKLNQSSFQDLIDGNQKNFHLIEKQITGNLNAQNKHIDSVVSVMKDLVKGSGTSSESLMSLQTSLLENGKALSEQNKKIIDLLSQSLQKQDAAVSKVDGLNLGQAKAGENIKFARDQMVALKEIVDRRLSAIEKNQQGLQESGDRVGQTVEIINQNLLTADTKINKLAEGLVQGTSEKIAGLSVTVNNLQEQTKEINQKMDTTLAKVDAGRADISLTSEKISKLIEILKAIAEEQGKFEQMLDTNDHANEEIKKALRDLRRKANVNISRNDKILKKLRRK